VSRQGFDRLNHLLDKQAWTILACTLPQRKRRWEQEKPEASLPKVVIVQGKMLAAKRAAESPASGARFVGQILQNTFDFAFYLVIQITIPKGIN